MFASTLDDLIVGSGTVIQRPLSLPQGLQELGCCYTIAWQKHDGLIIPTSMHGESEFLRESRSYAFRPNEGYVGSTFAAQDSIGSEVISDMLSVDPRAFLRKSAALLNGVSSVLFVFQDHPDTVLLEFGFTRPADAGLALPLLRTSHAHVLKKCDLQGIRCFGQPSHFDDVNSLSSRDSSNEALICRTRSASSEQTNNENSVSGTDESNEAVSCRTRSPSPERAESWCPSIGSRGHPFCCQLPCKYIRKRGCKDGPLCTRCHLCHYTRSCEKRSRNHKSLFENMMPAPGYWQVA